MEKRTKFRHRLHCSPSKYENRSFVCGNVGLLRTMIEDFPGSGVEGNRLFGAPNVTANVGITLAKDQWNASFSARYSDSYFTGINNRPRGKVDPYVTASAKASYAFNDNLRLFAEVKNIFEADGAVAFYPGATTATDTAVLLQPRIFRVGLSARF